jgi:hypothetical protein
MESKDIIFDKNLRKCTFIKRLNSEIGINLSDSLYASEEDLTEEYKTKIANFVNNVDSWYNKSINAILEWAKQEYNIDAQINDLELLNIYVLYEQNDNELYGIEFRTEFDVEHGCGIKILGNSFEIVEIGTADVAFC